MIKHTAVVNIQKEKFDRVNHLLAIDSLEDLTAEELIKQGASIHYCESIFYVAFDNGSTLSFDLCSGSCNYWDEVVWISPDARKEIILDCEYKLGDIEVEIDSELYVVKVIKND